jgi:hypothetical protein
MKQMRACEVSALWYVQWVLGVLLHMPRGPFYSPKAARSRWSPFWKAQVATVRGRTGQFDAPPTNEQCKISFLLWRSSPLQQPALWRTGQSGATW